MTKSESKEETDHLSTLLPKNLILDLDENAILSSKIEHKESNVSYFLLN